MKTHWVNGMQNEEHRVIKSGRPLMPVSIVLAIHKAETKLKIYHFNSGKTKGKLK